MLPPHRSTYDCDRWYNAGTITTSAGVAGACEWSVCVINDKADVDEVGLHRASTGLVYFEDQLIPNGGGGAADHQFIFGDPGDRFVAGDWVGADVDTPGLFRPSAARWYLKFQNQQGNADADIPLGESSWLPVGGFWGFGRAAGS